MSMLEKLRARFRRRPPSAEELAAGEEGRQLLDAMSDNRASQGAASTRLGQPASVPITPDDTREPGEDA